MYTPPVTPWESEMPEVGDPTVLGKHDRVTAGWKPAVYEKKDTTRVVRKRQKSSCLARTEGAAEGRSGNWGEVVTR